MRKSGECNQRGNEKGENKVNVWYNMDDCMWKLVQTDKVYETHRC